MRDEQADDFEWAGATDRNRAVLASPPEHQFEADGDWYQSRKVHAEGGYLRPWVVRTEQAADCCLAHHFLLAEVAAMVAAAPCQEHPAAEN